MKKLLLFVLLFISVVANAQKGISYQAVILDPAKIEIPGQDISGQPLVNGNVSVKFVILSGTTSQFEEVQQTKTDAYGLVNLTIGSSASTAFNALTWDAVQKSMQVFVSFNNGVSYIKVSDQKLTYSPYALFSETAGKLGGILEITNGGTGSTTAVGARANLGLGNVDNTADASKPVSTATQAALNLKANAADVNTGLNLKAPLASPTFTGTVSGITKTMIGLGSVDNTTDAAKPISTATQTALDLKAPIASPTFTGTITSGSDFSGNGRIKILSNNNEYNDAVGNQLYIDSYVKTYTGPAGNIPVYSTAYINANTLFSSQNSITIDNATSLHLIPPTNYNVVASKLWALYAEGNIKSLGSIEATGYKIPNGTSSQYLMADGSVSNASATNLSSGTTGTLPIANGGTGSNTKNFVDLTTNQTIAGVKTFSSNISANGVTLGRGNGNNDESVAIGGGAMGASNVNGKRNTAVGYGAMRIYNGTSFDNNTSIGYFNLPYMTTGSGNTSIGAEAMLANIVGTQNTSVGNQSLISTTGNNNVGIGKRSGQTITSGSQNTIVGTDADVSSATLNNATAVGYGASVAASNTVQLGNTSVTSVNTSGSFKASSFIKTGGTSTQYLMADGSVSSSSGTNLSSGTTGTLPIASGGTGQTTVSGILSTLGFASNNIAIGSQAGTPNQDANKATIAIGGGAARTNQGQSSIAIGYVSGDTNQGANSVSIGGNAAQGGQGAQAVAIGFAAGQNGQGANSVAIGTFAGQSGQAANSIAINATGTSTPLNPTTTGFFVDPIINRTATSTALYYNTTTKEVTSGTAAPSYNLYQKTHGDLTLTTTVANLISLSLPAGSYLVTYTGMAYQGSGSGSEYVSSRISITDPGNLGGGDAIMVSRSVNDGRAHLVHQLGITLASAGTVSVFANTIYGNNGPTIITGARLTAVQVGAVINQ